MTRRTRRRRTRQEEAEEEEEQEEQEEQDEEEEPTDIKSNNPHLAGGEKRCKMRFGHANSCCCGWKRGSISDDGNLHSCTVPCKM